MNVQFTIDAKTYVEHRDDAFVIVTIDFESRKASRVLCGLNDNPANFPAEEADFEAVVTLWERLGFPNDTAEWFELRSPYPDVRLIQSNRTGEIIALSDDAWDGVVWTDEYTPTNVHVRIRPITVEYRPGEYAVIDYIDR